MNEASIFYKGRMHWLNEIQLFRKDLQRMKCEVNMLQVDIERNKDAGVQIQLFKDSIQQIDVDLDYTEKSILFSLNNGKTYWVDTNGNTFHPSAAAKIENDLFDRMKNSYINLIELSRSINNYHLQAYAVL